MEVQSMMPEQQNIEYKSVWKDEYLKWICGFANAHGGTLFIGKDDNDNVTGVKNAKKLLEDLPNKITTVLGIIADVNLHETEQCNKDTPEQLLDNLKLIDNGHLKRAALLLFHLDPEKFVTGAYIKIGFFRSESDLQFQDDIHGNLFEQIEKTMELL